MAINNDERLDRGEHDPRCGLREQEQAALKAVEFSPDGIVIVNGAGNIVIFNARAELLFDCDRAEVIGRHMGVLLPDEVRDNHEATHRRGYMANPQKRSMGAGLTLNGKKLGSGETFPCTIELSPFPIFGAGIHTMAVIRST